MAGLFTPTSRSTGGAIPNLKLTPTNSPFYSVRGPSKSPGKRQYSTTGAGTTSNAFPDCSLSLKRVVGCSTTAFDSHPPSRSFAYTAGAAAVVVSLDNDLNISQRFFRARPNAPTLTSVAAGASYSPSTPQNAAAQESRTRAAASLREAGIGFSPGPSYGEDSPSSKTWTARERIKAATCLSFSPDGRWLAVGETGYNPRVLIFSMSKDVPGDVPVAAMAEHTFGVRDVAFSPDSKYLASIGTANDGFIYIWSLNSTRPGLIQLYASNKCTSFIRQITWMGRCLVTVGTRHVKLWRTDEDVGDRKYKRKWRLTRKQQKVVGPGPRVLYGRNVLLGNMSDSTMSCVAAISEDKALVCSERGDVCLLEENGMRFSKVSDAGFGVNCVAVDPERKFAWVAGRNGSHSALVLKDIIPPTPPASPSSSRSSSPVLPSGCRRATVLAMASMLGHLFTLDSNRSLKIINMSTVDGVPLPSSVIRELPAHKDACLGVRTLPAGHASGAAFFTWSADGVILFWCLDGNCKEEFQVELEQPTDGEDDTPNELRVARVSKDSDFFVTGDKYGVLRIINGKSRQCTYDVKAHASDIMDIAIHNETVVSCARDRTVQVFVRNNDCWTLFQTLDDHTASVSRVMFMEDGNKLLSCSTDRTVVIREFCRREAIDGTVTSAYIPIRTLSTKASPIHMTSFSDVSTTLLVSTLDRQIVKFDMVTGKILSSFKVTDDTGDAVVIDAMSLTEDRGIPSKPRIIVGTSTTDKSIRLYDLNGGLIDKEWGHTEGVSDVALMEAEDGEEMKLISTGTDGTIMIWEFLSKEMEQKGLLDSPVVDSPSSLSPPKDLTATRTPLRRVLSKSELMDFSSKTSLLPDPARVSASQSVGSSSPPRPVRKKTSAYSLNRHSRILAYPTAPVTPQPAGDKQVATPSGAPSDDSSTSPSTPMFTPTPANPNGRESRKSTRERTPSPPDTQTKLPPPLRRSSHDTRIRGKSDTSQNGSSNVNGLAESLVRSLRSFRKKMDTSDTNPVRPEVLRDLQRELGLTIKDLEIRPKAKERTGSASAASRDNAINGTTAAATTGDAEMFAAMLEQYSTKLLSMVNDRLEEKFPKGEQGEDVKEMDRRKEKTVETTGEG